MSPEKTDLNDFSRCDAKTLRGFFSLGFVYSLKVSKEFETFFLFNNSQTFRQNLANIPLLSYERPKGMKQK